MNKTKTKEGRPIKPCVFSNERLTASNVDCGSLKGKTAHYSQELRCWFYIKEGVDFEEVEQRYIENRLTEVERTKRSSEYLFKAKKKAEEVNVREMADNV